MRNQDSEDSQTLNFVPDTIDGLLLWKMDKQWLWSILEWTYTCIRHLFL